jgi:uncharacterized protein (DUF427 family)
MDTESFMEDKVIGRDNLVYAEHPIRFEPTPRRVRAMVDGVAVADSKRAMLLTEHHKMPIYYFPVEDVRTELLEPSGRTRQDAHKGTQSLHTVRLGDRVIEAAAWMHDEPGADGADFRGYVAFYWAKLDAWYEEDEEVYAHPRDPYHRVDVLRSSRHVQVTVLGEVVADSSRPCVLVETGLPTRFYLPRQDVRLDLLVPSETSSRCPYKGTASYYSVRVGDTIAKDMAWYYRFPIPECTKIENMICFFDERVDSTVVDGEQLALPVTPWSGKRKLIKVQ